MSAETTTIPAHKCILALDRGGIRSVFSVEGFVKKGALIFKKQELKRILVLGTFGIIMISRVQANDGAASSDSKSIVSNLKTWSGTWHREDSTPFYHAEITLKPVSKGAMHFEIMALDGVQNGETEGVAKLKGTSLVWNSPEVSAQFIFSFRDKKIVVSTKGDANYYAGYGVSFDGVYSRQESPPPDHPLTDLGIFKNAVEEDRFQKLTGEYYELFIESIQLVDDESEEPPKMWWYTGFVRGDAIDRAAIIGIDGKGKLSAAVLDGKSGCVRYFSNADVSADVIPKPIADWISEHSFHNDLKIRKYLKPVVSNCWEKVLL